MRKIGMIIVIGLLSFAAGYIWPFRGKSTAPAQQVKALRTGQTNFINPLLEYEVPRNFFPELKTLDEDVLALVHKLEASGTVDEASVYFRSLNNGPWFGVDEDSNYFLASLLKVPIMMTFFKEAETNPGILEQKVSYDKSLKDLFGNANNTEYYKPDRQIEVGHTYTVSELIERMIIDSDNNAKNLLILQVDDPTKFSRIFTDFGFATAPELQSDKDSISVHEYASFYRILYNASYLTREASNKALELLSKSNFHRGISAGVPTSLQVAHKFGERSDTNFKQLHDCGIVYYPKNPYILCVMTRGKTFENLEKVISEISKNVYEQVDRQLK